MPTSRTAPSSPSRSLSGRSWCVTAAHHATKRILFIFYSLRSSQSSRRMTLTASSSGPTTPNSALPPEYSPTIFPRYSSLINGFIRCLYRNANFVLHPYRIIGILIAIMLFRRFTSLSESTLELASSTPTTRLMSRRPLAASRCPGSAKISARRRSTSTSKQRTSRSSTTEPTKATSYDKNIHAGWFYSIQHGNPAVFRLARLSEDNRNLKLLETFIQMSQKY